MTPLQTLENRASEIRARLSELGGLEDFADETRAELAASRRERQDNESKRTALRTAGDGPTPPVETRNDGEGLEPHPHPPAPTAPTGQHGRDGGQRHLQAFQMRRGQRVNTPTLRLGPWAGSLSMAEACWATGVLTFRENVHLSGRHKCRRQLFRELPC